MTLRERLVARGGWKEDATLDRHGPPYGPRNTFSNLAYGIAGAAIFFANPTVETGVLWFACTVLMFGSGYYHALKSTYHNAWDHNGMYLTFGALAVYGWGGPAWLMAAVAILYAWVGTYWRGLAHLDKQVAVLLALSLVPILWHQPGYGLGVLGIYGIGYGVQRLDHAHSPLVGLWGHALWHVITGLAIYLSGMA